MQRIGVIGAGTMGGGLAEVAARAGHDVVLCSRSRATAEAAVATLAAGLERLVLKGRLTRNGFEVAPNGVMAKCPSKYEPKPGVGKPGSSTGN